MLPDQAAWVRAEKTSLSGGPGGGMRLTFAPLSIKSFNASGFSTCAAKVSAVPLADTVLICAPCCNSMLISLVSPLYAAPMSGVEPFLLITFTFAPASARSCAHSSLPCQHARLIAVSSYLSVASTFAFCASSFFTRMGCAAAAAVMSGVFPSASVVSIDIPWPRSASICLSSPCSHALSRSWPESGAGVGCAVAVVIKPRRQRRCVFMEITAEKISRCARRRIPTFRSSARDKRRGTASGS